MEGSSSSSKSSPQSAVEDVAPGSMILILEDAKFKDGDVRLVFGDLLDEYGDLLLSCSSFPVI